MVTTTYIEGTFGVREIAGRTDPSGVAVDDLPLDEDRIINHILTEGMLTSDAFAVAEDAPASMTVVVGSGSAKEDLYVVQGDESGQHPYIVRLDDVTIDVPLDAADGSNPRIDQVWLVVQDDAYDASSRGLARLAYRKGDAAGTPSAPGPDGSWTAAALLATVAVGASVSSVTDSNVTDGRINAGVDVPLPGPWEVDGYAEADTYSLTGSYANAVAVTLDIPPDWRSWRCFATCSFTASGDLAAQSYYRLNIDGTDLQRVVGRVSANDDIEERSLSVVGARTGITTTGSRTVSLSTIEITGSTDLADLAIYARAVRTS